MENKLYRVIGKIPGAEVSLTAGSMTKTEAEKRAEIEKEEYEKAGVKGIKVKVIPDEHPGKWQKHVGH